ncbi:MAG: hypothetical protein M3P27_03405 [Acidobacteriota bacterium]|nr:hypothetical protein [Acidobacteriota bacterium]
MPSNVRPFPGPVPPVPAAGANGVLDKAGLDNDADAPPPVWLARSMMVVFVAFCVEVGLVLIAVPWLPHLWHENSLLTSFPAIRAFIAHDFVRGVTTGIGVLDIWLGIYEAVHYRDPKPPTAG